MLSQTRTRLGTSMADYLSKENIRVYEKAEGWYNLRKV